MNLLNWLIGKWKCENFLTVRVEERFDLIIPISYGTGKNSLTSATNEIAWKTARVAKEHLEAKVVLSNCAYIFPGAEESEWHFRRCIFYQHGIVSHRANDMNNSVQEATAIAEYVTQNRLPSHRILIVTGEMHSRSARYIWGKVFPNSEIKVVCVPSGFEWQANHPVFIQRGPWKWFLANVVRQVLLRTFGLNIIGRLHHRSEG